MYVLIYYSTYSSHNTTMLQSINFRMYPYGLNTSKTFGLLKTWYILSSFHSTLQLPGGFKGTKHCGRGQKRLAWTQNIPFFMIEPKVQFASIAIVWWCSVILCWKKIGRILQSTFYKKHFYAEFSLKNIFNMFNMALNSNSK